MTVKVAESLNNSIYIKYVISLNLNMEFSFSKYVKAINNMMSRTTHKVVRKSIGLVKYYCDFWEGIFHTLQPLNF